MRLDDLRLLATVVEEGSFTSAGRALGLPKQTVSRRIAALEAELKVTLLHRTTRRVRPTDVGAAYAERCAEVVRLAEEATRAVTDAHAEPRGTLRITADPVLGEAVLPALVTAYAARFPEVRVEVALTRRKVDLIEEGFDLALRVGWLADPALVASRLGPATVRYAASPTYLARRGAPDAPDALAEHDTVVVGTEGAVVRWPFRGPDPRRPRMVEVTGRIRTNSLALAHEAVRSGLGIGLFPAFVCEADLASGALVPVLEEDTLEAGAIWLVRPAARALSARVRAFVDLLAGTGA